MNPFRQLSQIEEKEIFSGFFSRMIHTEGMTIGHLRVLQDHAVPEHHHVHEQVTIVLSGELEMTVDGQSKACKPGDVVVIPSNARHSARGLTDCLVIDIFQPVREDYRG